MELKFNEKSHKWLNRAPRQDKERIISKLEFYAAMDNPLKFAVPIVGSVFGQYRFRIGDFRVIFDIQNNIIRVLKIGHRREIYN